MEYNHRVGNLSCRSKLARVDGGRVVERLEGRTRLNLCLSSADKLIIRIKLASTYKGINITV